MLRKLADKVSAILADPYEALDGDDTHGKPFERRRDRLQREWSATVDLVFPRLLVHGVQSPAVAGEPGHG